MAFGILHVRDNGRTLNDVCVCVCVCARTHTHTQGVPGGMDKTSGECSLC